MSWAAHEPTIDQVTVLRRFVGVFFWPKVFGVSLRNLYLKGPHLDCSKAKRDIFTLILVHNLW